MAITESEKDKALEILRQFEDEQSHTVRDSIDNDCPEKEFEPGSPDGECEGDGHYMCLECVHYKN